MIALLKAALLGIVLTLIGAGIFGSAGTTAGFLNVHLVTIMDYHVHWSWPLFAGFTGLGWAILWMMD
jgi:hypothetical protein